MNAEGTFRESRLPERANPTEEPKNIYCARKTKKKTKQITKCLFIYLQS